jgi:hypothetical protein
MLNGSYVSLFDVVQQCRQYDDFLILLTDGFELHRIFPNMKSKAEYLQLAQSVPIKEVFKDLNIPPGIIDANIYNFSQIPYTIISNATYNYTNNTNEDLHSFLQSVCQEFRSFISSITLFADNILKLKHIYGLNIYIDGIKTIDNITIRPITDSDKQFLDLTSNPVFAAPCSSLAIFENEEKFPLDALISKSGKVNRNIVQFDRTILFAKIAVAITLAYSDLHSDFTPVQEVFAFTRHPFCSSNQKQSVKDCRRITINDDVISRASKYLKQLNSLSEDVINSLIIAMKRLLSAKVHTIDAIDAFIDAAIVWESLLGSKEEEFATAIHLMGIAKKEDVKRLYKLRSQIVHGNPKIGSINLAKRNSISNLTPDSISSMLDDLQKTIKIAMEVFKYVITDEELKQESSSEERVKCVLQKLPFGCISSAQE